MKRETNKNTAEIVSFRPVDPYRSRLMDVVQKLGVPRSELANEAFVIGFEEAIKRAVKRQRKEAEDRLRAINVSFNSALAQSPEPQHLRAA